MVHFVGAGPGAPDLITQRGAAFLQAADCIIYAGSLVNPALLGLAKPGCAIYNSAEMTLEQVLDVMRRMEAAGKSTVRLHTDSFADPEPADEPGYTDKVVMASGSFTEGSTIEISCDGPLRTPYTCYLQGGVNFTAGRAAVLNAVQNAFFAD